ncbi:MAG: hypothetical protein NVS9B10_15030 [Nevskia sp.]
MSALDDRPLRTAVCSAHREFTSTLFYKHGELERWSECPTCCEEARANQKAQLRASELAERLGNVGIPARYRGASMKQVSEPIRSKLNTAADLMWAGKAHGAVVIAGDVGVGKTLSLAAFGNEWIKRGERSTAVYVTAAAFCAEMRNTWARNSYERESDVFKRYAGARMLLLDDLGAGKAQDAELVATLIDHRAAEMLMGRTLVATNIAAVNFDAVFGLRTADRLREGATLIPMIGASRRRPLA